MNYQQNYYDHIAETLKRLDQLADEMFMERRKLRLTLMQMSNDAAVRNADDLRRGDPNVAPNGVGAKSVVRSPRVVEAPAEEPVKPKKPRKVRKIRPYLSHEIADWLDEHPTCTFTASDITKALKALHGSVALALSKNLYDRWECVLEEPIPGRPGCARRHYRSVKYHELERATRPEGEAS